MVWEQGGLFFGSPGPDVIGLIAVSGSLAVSVPVWEFGPCCPQSVNCEGAGKVQR
jgi:hypothetical protein